ncbi:hypothetical protein, partial [Paraglaciecola hydrolytica]|uniref:hypothetical protein n=1 Tax=Paraglaciecola hydrolytica TaxID=1799789 RepID=UPI00138ED67F
DDFISRVIATERYSVSSFEETYSKIRINLPPSISPSYLVEGKAATPSQNGLYIFVTPEIKLLYIKIMSFDGSYNAKAVVNIRTDNSKWINIELPSKYGEIYKLYSSESFALQAYILTKDDESRPIQKIFPSSWGEPIFDEKKAPQYFVVIHSFGGSLNYEYFSKNGEYKKLNCKKIEQDWGIMGLRKLSSILSNVEDNNNVYNFSYKCPINSGDFEISNVSKVQFNYGSDSLRKSYFVNIVK